MPSSCHFCEGSILIAFVFSVPGATESRDGAPVAGDTGENLSSALEHLHSARPRLFPSLNRYDYRITNAFQEPTAEALGHKRSEASDSDVRSPLNVQRVLADLDGCSLVILSGNKAKLLATDIRNAEMAVIEVPHVGNKGLNNSFEVPVNMASASSSDRRRYRIHLWGNAVLEQIGSLRDTSSLKANLG